MATTTINGKVYELISFNNLVNGDKKTGRVDPCTLCDLEREDINTCNQVNCITEKEFFYLKQK